MFSFDDLPITILDVRAGSSGAQVSAQIVQRVSGSGSLLDETGYNALTNESLWPWPNEARIKADMSAVLDKSGITIALAALVARIISHRLPGIFGVTWAPPTTMV